MRHIVLRFSGSQGFMYNDLDPLASCILGGELRLAALSPLKLKVYELGAWCKRKSHSTHLLDSTAPGIEPETWPILVSRLDQLRQHTVMVYHIKVPCLYPLAMHRHLIRPLVLSYTNYSPPNTYMSLN